MTNLFREHMETVAEQARRLSSGTLATLTGYKEYAILDDLREAFAVWCEAQPPGRFDS